MRMIQSIQRNQWLLSLSSGFLLCLAFPKIDQGWLAWGALVPLLLAVRQATPRTGFVLGLAAGLVQYLGLMYWTAYTMHVYGQVPLVLSILVLLLFAAILAIYTALFPMLVCWLCRKPWHLVVLSPAAWVMLEWLRTWLFTGFPWELLGYSQYDRLWVIQIADLFGVPAISALIVFFNAVLCLAFLGWVDKRWQTYPVERKTVLRAGIALAGVLLVAAVYGIYRLQAVDAMAAKADRAKVSVVQGNIDQSVKWDAAFQVLTTVKYRSLSLEAAGNGADLIIWPETAAPFYMFHDKLLTDMVLQGVKTAGTDFIIGSPAAQVENGETYYFNRAYLITPEGAVAGHYDKVHLVPFGEYVPLQRLFPFVDKLVAQVGDFKAGRRGDTLVWKGRPLGMLICYEAIFPGLARAMVQNGAQMLINITNDAWFGRTSAAHQHFSMAVLRSVENRRFQVRAANTGISGFIDPTGRILAASALYADATLTAQVALLKGRTLYSRWGDWPLVAACSLALAAPVVVRRIRGRGLSART
ncbi:MAG: apolipoprotein N-acyltransferase [Desulfobacteraceae bacterium]|nr:MAG: apolipoprotein N-acyltransferase [Desulfobacteraceae bacterium]